MASIARDNALILLQGTNRIGSNFREPQGTARLYFGAANGFNKGRPLLGWNSAH